MVLNCFYFYFFSNHLINVQWFHFIGHIQSPCAFKMQYNKRKCQPRNIIRFQCNWFNVEEPVECKTSKMLKSIDALVLLWCVLLILVRCICCHIQSVVLSHIQTHTHTQRAYIHRFGIPKTNTWPIVYNYT